MRWQWKYRTAEVCDRCAVEIGPRTPHVRVARFVERFNRRGVVTVLDDVPLLVLCLDCDRSSAPNYGLPTR